jgi:hypothetical protein
MKQLRRIPRSDDMNTRRLALVALVVAAGLGLAGCSFVGSPSPAASAAQGGPGNGNGYGGGQGGQGRFGGGAFPGAAGLVAAVSGSTAQVQSPTRQTAVTWTPSTVFTNQVSAASTDLKAGECVVARPAIPSGAGAKGGSGSGSGSNTTVAAATIEMSAPVDGACTAGFGGNRPGQRPSGAPTAAPGTGNGNGNGSTRGPRGFGAFGAVGTITSVSDGSLVVAERRGNSTQNVTVTWGSSTTFTKLQAGAASDVVVGVCVLAQGKTDDTGALTATTIAVSPAVDGTCTTGFGGRGGGQGGPGGGATPGTGTGTGGKNA